MIAALLIIVVVSAILLTHAESERKPINRNFSDNIVMTHNQTYDMHLTGMFTIEEN
jgi:hypothetical protein